VALVAEAEGSLSVAAINSKEGRKGAEMVRRVELGWLDGSPHLSLPREMALQDLHTFILIHLSCLV
jgi:hypothetical protein